MAAVKESNSLSRPKHISITKALSRAPKAPDYVIEGLPVGAVGGLVSPGGTGKTFFALQLAVAQALGMPFLGGLYKAPSTTARRQEPQKVAFVLAEEPADIVTARVHAVVSHLLDELHSADDAQARSDSVALLADNLLLYPMAEQGQMRLDVEHPEAWSIEVLQDMTRGTRLVILDPFRQFHGGEENASWDMTFVLKRLQKLASSNKCAVLLTHHANKAASANSAGDRAASARGSSAFTDTVRWQANLSPADDTLITSSGLDTADKHLLLRLDLSKSNYLRPQPPLLLRRSESGAFELAVKQAESSTRTTPSARRPRKR